METFINESLQNNIDAMLNKEYDDANRFWAYKSIIQDKLNGLPDSDQKINDFNYKYMVIIYKLCLKNLESLNNCADTMKGLNDTNFKKMADYTLFTLRKLFEVLTKDKIHLINLEKTSKFLLDIFITTVPNKHWVSGFTILIRYIIVLLESELPIPTVKSL